MYKVECVEEKVLITEEMDLKNCMEQEILSDFHGVISWRRE